jgi:hypothetical protein
MQGEGKSGEILRRETKRGHTRGGRGGGRTTDNRHQTTDSRQQTADGRRSKTVDSNRADSRCQKVYDREQQVMLCTFKFILKRK